MNDYYRGLSGLRPAGPWRLTCQFPWRVRCPWRYPEEAVLSLGFSPSVYCRSLHPSFSPCKQCSFLSPRTDAELGTGPAISQVQLLLEQATLGTTGMLDTLTVCTANHAGKAQVAASQLNKREINGLLKPPISYSEKRSGNTNQW